MNRISEAATTSKHRRPGRADQEDRFARFARGSLRQPVTPCAHRPSTIGLLLMNRVLWVAQGWLDVIFSSRARSSSPGRMPSWHGSKGWEGGGGWLGPLRLRGRAARGRAAASGRDHRAHDRHGGPRHGHRDDAHARRGRHAHDPCDHLPERPSSPIRGEAPRPPDSFSSLRGCRPLLDAAMPSRACLWAPRPSRGFFAYPSLKLRHGA